MPGPEPLTMLNATHVCVIPVWRRPDILGACLSAITADRGHKKWAFLFSVDRGADVANHPLIAALGATKQVVRQPNHPYPDKTYNILAGLKVAAKLPAVEKVMLLPEDYIVLPGYFDWHADTMSAFRPPAWSVTALERVESTIRTITQPAACTTWSIDTIRAALSRYPESYFLFGDTFRKKVWPTFAQKGVSFDQLMAELAAKNAVDPSMQIWRSPGNALAYHVGFYKEPSSPAGLRWHRETDAMTFGRKVERIRGMTADELNERRDQHIPPMAPIVVTKKTAPAPPAPPPSSPPPAAA